MKITACHAPLGKLFALSVLGLLLLADLFFFTPRLDILPVFEGAGNNNTSHIGVDFVYYLDAIKLFQQSLDPRDLNSGISLGGMRWLYPPPVLEFFGYFKIDVSRESWILSGLSYFISLVLLCAFKISRLSLESNQRGIFAVLVMIVVVIGWPPFLFRSIHTLNIGTLILITAFAAILLANRPNWIYYASIFMVAYLKPQYCLLLFLMTVAERRLVALEVCLAALLFLFHALSAIFFSKSYFIWVNDALLGYAFGTANSGIWLGSFFQSSNAIKVLIGVLILVALVKFYLKVDFRHVPVRARSLLVFTSISLVIPRYYEYELVQIYFATFALIFLAPKLSVFYLYTIGLIMLMFYRLISVGSGSNYYTPGASALLLGLSLAIVFWTARSFQKTAELKPADMNI